MRIKIGVLLPSSGYIPSIAKDIRLALCLGLDEKKIDYELCIETTRFNANKNVLISKFQDLLIKHDVDVVIAPLNSSILDHVAPLFSQNKVPLIANTLGEDIIAETSFDPYLFINSMNLWQTSWMSGYWGAQSFGKRAVSIMGYHEAGYGMSFAFALGVESQHGELVQTATTHINSSTESPTEKLLEIAELNPDFVMGFYAGKEANSFMTAYSEHISAPLLSTPFCLSNSLLAELGDKALGIPSLSSWNTETSAAMDFRQKYYTESDKEPNAYALLAYETGLMLSMAINNHGKPLAEGLRMSEIAGPRGKLFFDKTMQTIQTNDYLYEVSSRPDGTYYNKVVKELSLPPLFNEQLSLAQLNIAKQGWLNPYLIA